MTYPSSSLARKCLTHTLKNHDFSTFVTLRNLLGFWWKAYQMIDLDEIYRSIIKKYGFEYELPPHYRVLKNEVFEGSLTSRMEAETFELCKISWKNRFLWVWNRVWWLYLEKKFSLKNWGKNMVHGIPYWKNQPHITNNDNYCWNQDAKRSCRPIVRPIQNGRIIIKFLE